MTMWRSNEPVEDDISDLPGIDFQNKCRRARRRAWRDGLSDQTVVKTLENVRSYRAFERALVGSVDPRSVLELALVHRLASLLWRLRRASAIETGLFEMHAELRLARRQDRSRGPGQPGTLQTPTQANGHKVAPGSNGRDDPPASGQESPSMSMRPSPASWSKSRAIAQCFLVFPILTRPCLTAWAATKRDYGAKPRKPSGALRLCDNRHGAQCDGHFANPACSLIGMPSARE
jgi:hypothetical protein